MELVGRLLDASIDHGRTEEATLKSALLDPATSRSDEGSSPATVRSSKFISFRDVVKIERRRTLDVSAHSRLGTEWRWLSTVSFWLSACFIMGSILFTVGAAASMLGPLFLHERGGLPNWLTRGLVTYTYFAGGCYFTIGAYLGFFNVINFGREEVSELLWWSTTSASAPSAAAYWGSLLYLVGALFFQVCVRSGIAIGVPSDCHRIAIGLPSGCRRVAIRLPSDCRRIAISVNRVCFERRIFCAGRRRRRRRRGTRRAVVGLNIPRVAPSGVC